MPQNSSQLDRRRFMVYSSVCALAPSAMALPANNMALPANHDGTLETAQESLAIGYWPGTRGGCPQADAERLLNGEGRRAGTLPKIVPARDLSAGDESLQRGDATVTVHGLIGEVADLAASGPRSAALQVHFRRSDTELPGTLKFNSWSVENGPLFKVSNAVEFRVPIDTTGLELSLDLDHTATAADRLRRIFLGRSYKEFAARLGLGGERDQPKLKQGFYFIPLRQEAFRSANAMSGLEVQAEPCLLLSVKTA